MSPITSPNNTYSPSNVMFFLMTLLGMWMCISSNNWLFLWAGLELNMYAFIPLLLSKKKLLLKEATVKYFLAQAVGSTLLLIIFFLPSFSYSQTSLSTILKSSLLISALLLKSGLPPFHFWYPMVMNLSSWRICWMLTVPQKISPLLILNALPFNMYFMMMISTMILLWGSIMLNNQTNMRTMMAYSSISQTGWIVLLGQSNFIIMMMMMMNYFIIVTTIMSMMNYSTWNLNNTSDTNSSSLYTFIMMTQLLHLSGFPPMMGFILKLWGLNFLISMDLYFLTMLYITGTLISLLFYLKTMLFTFWSTNSKINLKMMYMKKILMLPFMTIMLLSLGIILLFLPILNTLL